MPRSLYGRAALILLVPVVVLQLVVSIVFIQRHYEGVTQQMTRNVAVELRYLLRIIDQADGVDQAVSTVSEVASHLNFKIALMSEPPEQDQRNFYDLSGRAMATTLREELPGMHAVDLLTNRRALVWIDSNKGPVEAGFDRRRVSASNPHQLLVLMVFAGVLLTLIAYIFLRNQLRPIKRLARASEAFGKGRTVPYKPSGALEVRAAGNAFLDMRARIERQIEQRTMMLSGVSHDLRTPLTRLRLGLELLDGAGDAEAIQRDIDDMERLLDEFLAFARDDSLDDPIETDPIELVQTVVARFEATGENVGFASATGSGWALLRPMAITRALENLIGNAVRYGTRCEASVSVADATVTIIIEDNGPGIPEEQREDALKPFSRLDGARNQDKGSGVGLGLAIASDIARRHGGKLSLGKSQHLGGLKAELVLAR